jgi:hypothetical protein
MRGCVGQRAAWAVYRHAVVAAAASFPGRLARPPRCPAPCADDIAQATLQLPPSAASALARQPGWVRAALEPQRRVIFLDTAAAAGAREAGGPPPPRCWARGRGLPLCAAASPRRPVRARLTSGPRLPAVAGDAVSNPGEARLLLLLLQAAAAAGLPQEHFAAISPYRSQVRASFGGVGGGRVIPRCACPPCHPAMPWHQPPANQPSPPPNLRPAPRSLSPPPPPPSPHHWARWRCWIACAVGAGWAGWRC